MSCEDRKCVQMNACRCTEKFSCKVDERMQSHASATRQMQGDDNTILSTEVRWCAWQQLLQLEELVALTAVLYFSDEMLKSRTIHKLSLLRPLRLEHMLAFCVQNHDRLSTRSHQRSQAKHHPLQATCSLVRVCPSCQTAARRAAYQPFPRLQSIMHSQLEVQAYKFHL